MTHMDIQSQITQALPVAKAGSTGMTDLGGLNRVQQANTFPGAQIVNTDSSNFSVPGFDGATPVTDYSSVAAAFKDNNLPVAQNPQKMSFSSETPALAQPSTQIDPIAINALAEDPTLLDSSTYDATKRSIQQASTVGQFKADVAERTTADLEKTYFTNFGVLAASTATEDDVVSGPSYLTGDTDVLYAGTDGDYASDNPEKQIKAAGSALSENKIPLMLGAYQHPNFANSDPAIKNVNVSAMSDNLVDDATKLLSAGTPLMSTSAPEPKLFQIGLQVNPEAYWQRPALQTNKKYYVQQPDGRIGYDPELQIPLPDAAQTFSQPYQPYAQDKTIGDLNNKLQLPGLSHEIVGTKSSTGSIAQLLQEYNPLVPPPVDLKGKALLFDEAAAKAHNNKDGAPDQVSPYYAAANPATISSHYA